MGMAQGVGRLIGAVSYTHLDGERQKVMIAKTLAQNTPIVFLDEPTAFLDYPSKVEILQLLMKLTRERELTVFLSTHDLELALQIADEVWLIDKALGVTIGTPEDLALNGDLGRYFERDGVEFDADSGLFRISSVPLASVKVSGAGPVSYTHLDVYKRQPMKSTASYAMSTITYACRSVSARGA